MFTVCPKCALTLVVTPQDLRVAQGYVRCGRCSNVFNAILNLSDDRGALATPTPGTTTSASTPSTTALRQSPAAASEPPADSLSDTGESEAIYAEPDPQELKSGAVLTAAQRSAPPPGPAAKPTPAPPPPPPPSRRLLDSEKRYSDTEGIDTFSDSELEFNPEKTDVTKVFIEAPAVTFKGNAATGTFRKIVLRPEDREALASPPPPAPPPPPPAPKPAAPAPAPAARASAPTGPLARRSPAPAPAPAPVPPPAPAPAPAPVPISSRPSAPPPPPPPRDEDEEEEIQFDDELRTLAARVGTQGARPEPLRPAPRGRPLDFADDEPLQVRPIPRKGLSPVPESAQAFDEEQEEEDEAPMGDVRARAKPIPLARGPARGGFGRGPGEADLAVDDEIRAEGIAESLAPAPVRKARSALWIAGASFLALAFVAQLVHHNRHELATRASLNRPLTQFYRAIGVPLVPAWDLTDYDVRQLGASTSGSDDGTLTVRASLQNNARQPRPLPLLRITMQDRYGNRVASRDVPPTAYVPGAVPPEAQLAAGQRIDTEMTFKDPGQDAVGFEIDACLPTASGQIACANDRAVASR